MCHADQAGLCPLWILPRTFHHNPAALLAWRGKKELFLQAQQQQKDKRLNEGGEQGQTFWTMHLGFPAWDELGILQQVLRWVLGVSDNQSYGSNT